VPPPTMQRMLQDLHLNYRRAVGAPATAAFGDIRSSTIDQPRAGIDQRRLERISEYSGTLHDIVTRARAPVGDPGIAVDERKITPAQAATITKAWELALDPVDISTSVWLEDRDVVTRVCSDRNDASVVALLAFHGDMVGLGLRSWTELMRLVAQFVATLTGLLLRRLRTSRTLRRLAPPSAERKRAPEPRQLVLTRAHELFGTGGKLFITDAPDGAGGGIRTLVQVTGDVVTRATPDSLLDAGLLKQHQAKIDAWFAKLDRDWRRARAALRGVAAAGTTALLARDLTTFSHASGVRLLLLALPVVPPVLGRGLGLAARRFILHAAKGPKALLPARS
jgi:hypothetical protein